MDKKLLIVLTAILAFGLFLAFSPSSITGHTSVGLPSAPTNSSGGSEELPGIMSITGGAISEEKNGS